MSDLEKISEEKFLNANAEKEGISWLGTHFHRQINKIRWYQRGYLFVAILLIIITVCQFNKYPEFSREAIESIAKDFGKKEYEMKYLFVAYLVKKIALFGFLFSGIIYFLKLFSNTRKMKIEYRDKAIFADTLVAIIDNEKFDNKYGEVAISCVLPKIFKPTNEAIGNEKTESSPNLILDELYKKIKK